VLPAPLTETGPFYTSVQPGELVYWNPEDHFTMIFKPTSSPGQLTKLGEITSDLSVFDQLPANVEIRVEIAPR